MPIDSILSASAPAADRAAALFGEQRLPLLRYLRTLGLPLPDCEDVMQETFLALHRHLAAGKPDSNLRGWLFRVAHNLALKSRHSRLRFWEAIVDHFFDSRPGPEELASLRQRSRRLRNVVRALPQRDRACLALKAEGFGYREIGEIVGVSVGTVASSVARSMERLATLEAKLR